MRVRQAQRTQSISHLSPGRPQVRNAEARRRSRAHRPPRQFSRAWRRLGGAFRLQGKIEKFLLLAAKQREDAMRRQFRSAARRNRNNRRISRPPAPCRRALLRRSVRASRNFRARRRSARPFRKIARPEWRARLPAPPPASLRPFPRRQNLPLRARGSLGRIGEKARRRAAPRPASRAMVALVRRLGL